MSDLKGKVAVVTGSSKGIGAAIVERLASNGASVVVNYSRTAAPAQALVERITSDGGKAIAVQADLSKSEEIAKLFSETIKAFGRLDILGTAARIVRDGLVPLDQSDGIQQLFHRSPVQRVELIGTGQGQARGRATNAQGYVFEIRRCLRRFSKSLIHEIVRQLVYM